MFIFVMCLGFFPEVLISFYKIKKSQEIILFESSYSNVEVNKINILKSS